MKTRVQCFVLKKQLVQKTSGFRPVETETQLLCQFAKLEKALHTDPPKRCVRFLAMVKINTEPAHKGEKIAYRVFELVHARWFNYVIANWSP